MSTRDDALLARIVADTLDELAEPTEPRPFDEVADDIVARVRRGR